MVLIGVEVSTYVSYYLRTIVTIFIDANLGPAVTLFIVEGEHIITFAKFKLDGMDFRAVDCLSSLIQNK
jgi:hypothetical protein